MKKIAVVSFALILAAVQGCGTPCDEANARVEAKNAECGVDAGGEGEGEGEGEAECDEDDAAAATEFADCYTVAGCEHVFGGDDFDAASEAFTTFSECIAE